MSAPTHDNALEMKNRLEFAKGVLLQLKETCLFNDHIDRAIEDINDILSQTDEPKIKIS